MVEHARLICRSDELPESGRVRFQVERYGRQGTYSFVARYTGHRYVCPSQRMQTCPGGAGLDAGRVCDTSHDNIWQAATHGAYHSPATGLMPWRGLARADRCVLIGGDRKSMGQVYFERTEIR